MKKKNQEGERKFLNLSAGSRRVDFPRSIYSGLIQSWELETVYLS